MERTLNWENVRLAGRYHVLRTLGTGGMALVYLAHDHHLDCEVVVKTPRPEVFTGSVVARFTREIRSLVRLTHPHIVKILDVGEHEGHPFVVLHYLAGGSLRDRQKRHGDRTADPMPVESLCDWLLEVAEVLDFIHEQGCVHRDVKPDNILFDPHGHAYLADFGVAKLLETDESGISATSVTGTGAMVGTPWYMAPELVQGGTIDGRVDQYALAVTVHELLAGKVPFDGPFRAAILMAHTSGEAPLLSNLVPTVPHSLAEVVKQAMSRDPEERFPDCRSFAQSALEALASAGAGKLHIPVPGWWYARPENDPSAQWWEVSETPAAVTLTPGEVYWLLARDGVNDRQLGALARLAPLPALRSLGLSFLHRLTDAGLAHLRGLSHLEELSLSQCPRISDAGVAHLAALTCLRSLSLDETLVTDAGLAVLESLTQLRALNLAGCRAITDAGLAHVAGRVQLQKLVMSGCGGISDAGLDPLRRLADLRVLDIGLTGVTDAGLARLRMLDRLEYLYLAGLAGVTDAGLAHLSELTGLRGLDLRGCVGVTVAGVEALHAAVPGCRVSGP